MGIKPSSASWSTSPLDDCLDKLGVCEEEVTECRFRVEALEAANVLMQHPVVLIGLAMVLAALLLLTARLLPSSPSARVWRLLTAASAVPAAWRGRPLTWRWPPVAWRPGLHLSSLSWTG